MKFLASILAALPALVLAQSAAVSVRPPTVTGPIALTSALKAQAHGYPYNATPIDLAKAGYVEEEFFIEGTANNYSTPAGERGTLIDGGHPYKTRIVVRRPRQASRFNGTAILEWYNVSQGHDGEYEWFQSHDHFVRAGYAWVGVSNQAVGVNALRDWSPARYGTLDVSQGGAIMGDALSYDIFTAAAMAVRGAASGDVMGGLKAVRLIATGHSQSAGRLYTYLHAVHPLGAAVYDAVLLHGGGGKVSPTLNVKVFKYLDETDVIGQRNNAQPDTDSYRQWEVAGSSHLDAQFSRSLAALGLRVSGMAPVEGSPSIEGPSISGGEKGNGGEGNGGGAANAGPNGGCALPPFSRVPSYHALNAAFDHTARWVKDGTAPPVSPRIDLTQLPPAEARGGRGPSGPRWEYVRDDAGLVRGGIRLAAMAAPVATNTGQNSGGQAAGGERNCGLMGSSQPFDEARLNTLYPTHAAYVNRVKDATGKNLKSGFILKPDADATIREAERSNIGRSRTGTK